MSVLAESQLKAVSTARRAEHIKNVFGANIKFKRAMINKVLELGSSSMSEVSAFAYVGQMLSWTDMSAMTSICDMLLSVNSPVLYDPAVAMRS